MKRSRDALSQKAEHNAVSTPVPNDFEPERKRLKLPEFVKPRPKKMREIATPRPLWAPLTPHGKGEPESLPGNQSNSTLNLSDTSLVSDLEDEDLEAEIKYCELCSNRENVS